MGPTRRNRGPPPHPRDRPNWPNMHEGQRRYAVEQFYRYFQNRGIANPHLQPTPVIDNEPQPGTSTGQRHRPDPLLQTHPYFERPSPEPNPTPTPSPPPSDPTNFELIEPPAKVPRIGAEETVGEDRDEEFEEVLHNLLQPRAEDDDAWENDEWWDNDWDYLLGQQNQDVEMTSLTGTAAGAADTTSGEPAAKKRRVQTPGKGGDGALGQGNGGMQVARQTHFSNLNTWHFQKVHRFLTFGYAFRYIKESVPATLKSLMITTPYAEVPWDKTFFYMSPTEFNMIPFTGMEVEKVSVRIIQRKVRVAFPTNASTTELATLNQNAFTATAVGLNKALFGVNKTYTSDDTAPMFPTAITDVTAGNYVTLYNNLYGNPNNDVVASTDQPPNNICGTPAILQQYFCTVSPGPATRDPVYVAQDIGHQDIQTHITEHLAGEASDAVVLEMKYKPVYAPINPPLTNLYCNVNGTTLATDRTSILSKERNPQGNRRVTYNNLATNAAQRNEYLSETLGFMTENMPTFAGSQNFKFFPMDFGNRSRTQHGDMSCSEQPSIHIGVKPVPKLTSTLAVALTSYTDVQAWWEIETHIFLKRNYASHWNHATDANVSSNQQRFFTTDSPDFYSETMYDGTYQITPGTTPSTTATTNTTSTVTSRMSH